MTFEGKFTNQKVTLPDLAKALVDVYPLANYSKVFYWAKTGHLATFRDPLVRQGHHYVDLEHLPSFLELLGLGKKEVLLVFKQLKSAF